MPNTQCLLVQAHKDISYFIDLAKCQPHVNIYVHLDAKSAYFPITETKHLPNIFLLRNRVTVYWGGFSQVQATLLLLHEAMANPANQYFHLISGEDVLLQPLDVILQQWQYEFNYAMMIQHRNVPQYHYRLKYAMPHADTDWQRSLLGKILTKTYQMRAKFSPPKTVMYGSQWFSATRQHLQRLLKYEAQASDLFRKKLVPDEHFFQYLIVNQNANDDSINVSNDNQRFIYFEENNNHPNYLDFADLHLAQQQGFWFARKVNNPVAMTWQEQFG